MSCHRTLAIGRDASCDVVLAHDTVSRVHAELVLGDGVMLLCDRASSHGLFLKTGAGWATVAQEVVEPGDTVLLGEVQITVAELIARANDR